MFRALREKLLGASKQAEEELDPQLNLTNLYLNFYIIFNGNLEMK